MSRKNWFVVTTWNADRMDKWFAFNRISGHVIGVVFRLPNGVTASGAKTYHSLSIGRYCRRSH